MKYLSNDSVAKKVEPKLKKTKSEILDLKNAKKAWKKRMSALIPGFKSSRGCIGMSTQKFIEIPELLKMAEIVAIDNN